MQGAFAIVNLLKRNHLLWILNIAGTSLGNEGVESLVEGLASNQTLLSLNLANNNLSGKGIENFIRAVAFTRLTHLSLASNKLSNAGCECLAALLLGSFGTMCPLRFLDLSRNEIGFTGSTKLFNAMSRNATLETLVLNDNPLSSQYNLALCHFLSDNLALKYLDLTNCDLRANGAAAIGDGLAKNHGLKTLLLSNNLLEDNEMGAFGTGIEKNSALKTLDIANNKISDRGGLLICAGLRRNEVLERINAKDNEFHDAVGQVLAEITRKQHNIAKLYLENNPISYKYINEIRANLVRNERFRSQQKAPTLQRELRELEMMDYDVSRIDRDMEYMYNEQRKAEEMLERQREKFEQMKEQEEAKTQAVIAELQVIKQVKIEKGVDYQSVLGDIGTERIHFDKEYRELDDQLGVLAAEVYKTTKDSKDHTATLLKRGYAEKRAQNTLQVARMNEDLENQKNKKNMAEMTLQALLKQIEVMTAEIDALKHPKTEEVKLREATVPPKKGESYSVQKAGGKKVRRKGKKSPVRASQS
jgi:Ran GTPase-activating protein (RanGAP) involved in mRNA processing and transport